MGAALKIFLILLIAAIVLQFGTVVAARAQTTVGEPDPLSSTRSLGDVIAGAGDKPLHLIFVHGMRAEGPGGAKRFLAALAKSIGHAGDGSQRMERHPLNLGAWPSEAKIGSKRVWEDAADWSASQPFVDRYILTGSDGTTIIVDEVNWWPLLFPLKCKFLVLPEHELSGADKDHLRLCARDDEPYHAWISQEELADALARRPSSGGGVKLNRLAKHQIMNWGLSDAVIALGPMRAYISETMNQAFAFAEAGSRGLAPEYVVISESLGSFAVLDAFDVGKPAVAAVLERTYNLYFFANQFALLELGRINGLPASPMLKGAPSSLVDQTASPPSPLAALAKWAKARDQLSDADGGRGVKQVIAFSDPSDVLTYRVPAIEGARVANVYIRNGGGFLGLVTNPIKAHAGHVANPRVLEAMLRRTGE